MGEVHNPTPYDEKGIKGEETSDLLVGCGETKEVETELVNTERIAEILRSIDQMEANRHDGASLSVDENTQPHVGEQQEEEAHGLRHRNVKPVSVEEESADIDKVDTNGPLQGIAEGGESKFVYASSVLCLLFYRIFIATNK